jgi:hypothetical protein
VRLSFRFCENQFKEQFLTQKKIHFYGICFWKNMVGEQWLNSLNNIDYSNRLPRGASYARKGAVEKIKVNGNDILNCSFKNHIKFMKFTSQVYKNL